jgi:hypothetical protein
METVTIRIQDHYAMPPICCACGAPAGSAKLTASASKARSGRILHLAFPLCDPCATTFATVHRRRRVSCLGGLALSLFMCLLAFGLSRLLQTTSSTLLDSLLGVLIILLPLVILGTLLAQWLVSIVGLSREERATYRLASKGATIRRYDPNELGVGYVTLGFANEEFADRFQEMNQGIVTAGRVGQSDSHE